MSSVTGATAVSLSASGAGASSSEGSRLADLQSALSAKRSALARARSEPEKAALQAEIDMLERQIEELKTRRDASGDGNAQARAAEEQARLLAPSSEGFDAQAPFGTRTLYL